MARPDLALEKLRQYKDDVDVHPTNLSRDVERQSATFAWWAELSSASKADLARYKLQEDVLEARLDKEARLHLEQRDVKVTEAQVTSYRKSQKEWQVLAARLIDAQEVVDLCDGVRQALYQKGQMLQALVTMRRQEWSQSPDGVGPAQIEFRKRQTETGGFKKRG